MISKLLMFVMISSILIGCGKVGPLNLPEDKLNKAIITYPCDADCQKAFEEEKKRQQSVVIQTN